MRILILAVGKDRSGPTSELVATYVKRCPWRIDFLELPAERHGSRQRRLADEAEKLKKTIPADAAVIALDEQGKDLDSRTFAKKLERFRDQGNTTITFLVGGADGLDPSLTSSADLTLAFGRQTWPHRLIRPMLAEQLYRASTILTNHPYHRD